MSNEITVVALGVVWGDVRVKYVKCQIWVTIVTFSIHDLFQSHFADVEFDNILKCHFQLVHVIFAK